MHVCVMRVQIQTYNVAIQERADFLVYLLQLMFI